METTSFVQFRSEFFRLYGEKAYQQAFDLAQEWDRQSGQRKSEVTCWQICTAALAGKPDLALQTFRNAMEDGFFWPPEGLRDDPDFGSLQGNAEYQRLVDQCGERLARARQNSQPVLRTVLPTGKGPHPLLLAFHGWGQSFDEFAPHWNSLAEAGWLVAVPQSSQQYAKGTFVWDDLEKATGEAQAHYQNLSAQYPIDRRQVVVAGFSQGGGVALWLALTQKFPVQGLIGVGPYLLSLKELLPQLTQVAIPGLRANLISGQNEEDHGMFATIEEVLQTLAVPYRHDRIPGIGHEFPPDFATHLQAALAYCLPDFARPADMISVSNFQPGDQASAKALILDGLVEHWGFLDPTKNPDLDDIAVHYAQATFLVARLDDGSLVGTGALVPRPGDSAEIVRMSVDRSLRRQGIGRMILQALIEHARQAGYRCITLETTASWQEVIAFYLDFGFHITHEQDGDVYFSLDLKDL